MALYGVGPLPLSTQEAGRLSPLLLAYIGDAVYELYVRSRFFSMTANAKRLHAQCVKWVSATGQERLWFALQDKLSTQEADVARKARNAKGTVPHHVEPATYRRSTSLEALVGYLYLTGQDERIAELLESAFHSVAQTSEAERE